MKVNKLRQFLEYLFVDDKVTMKQEKLMNFPTTPKQVEKLKQEAFNYLCELERLAKIGEKVEAICEELKIERN